MRMGLELREASHIRLKLNNDIIPMSVRVDWLRRSLALGMTLLQPQAETTLLVAPPACLEN